jgi:hypothetical protein
VKTMQTKKMWKNEKGILRDGGRREALEPAKGTKEGVNVSKRKVSDYYAHRYLCSSRKLRQSTRSQHLAKRRLALQVVRPR